MEASSEATHSIDRDRNRSAAQGSGPAHSAAGTFWFAGWLFTIGFAKLVWWKILLGLVVWPYYLSLALR